MDTTTPFTSPAAAQTRPLLYAKLSVKLPQIRLLELYPARDPSDGIDCTLHEHFVASIPSYKALSYTWNEDNSHKRGKEDELPHSHNQISIHLWDGLKNFEHSVTISKSLRLALRRLRQTENSILLWIDSLCINQEDAEERTSQVGLMAMIYQFAEEVIIWLGEREVEDELGEWLQGIHSRTVVYRDWSDHETARALVNQYIGGYQILRDDIETGPISPKRDVYGAFCLIWLLSHNYESSQIPFYHTKSFTNRFRMDWATQVSEGLRAIMQRNWWRRAWVVQETVLARKATVVYSTLAAPWVMFAKAANVYLGEQLAEDIDQRRMLQSLILTFASYSQEPVRTSDALGDFCATVLSIENTRQEWSLQRPIQLLTLLRRFRSRRASDDRDKVFSLLGLVDRWMKAPLPIDYSMPVGYLYALTAANIIEDSQSLSILVDVNWSLGARSSDNYMFSVPPLLSWPPDWSYASANGGFDMERTSRFEHYSAGLTPGYAYIHAPGVLETRGFVIGQVRTIAPDTPQDAIERLRQTLVKWKDWWQDNTRCSYESQTLFWKTVCGGCLYNPRSQDDIGSPETPYTQASSDRIQSGMQAWLTDNTTNRNRKTTMIADLVTNSYKEPEAVTHLKNSFYYSVRSFTVSRWLFAFDRPLKQPSVAIQWPDCGDIGIGPPNMQAEDIVYIPHGSKVPLIIRPNYATQPQQDQHNNSQTSVAPGQNSHDKRKLIGPGDNKPVRCNEAHLTHTVIGAAYINGEMYASESKHDPSQAVTIFLQ